LFSIPPEFARLKTGEFAPSSINGEEELSDNSLDQLNATGGWLLADHCIAGYAIPEFFKNSQVWRSFAQKRFHQPIGVLKLFLEFFNKNFRLE